MERLLEAAELEVKTCGDIYRAMARVAQAASQPDSEMPTVVVHLDGFSVADTEFFSIASRLRPQPAIYVYGTSDELLATAIGRGATGEATAALVDSLRPARPAPESPEVMAADELASPVASLVVEPAASEDEPEVDLEFGAGDLVEEDAAVDADQIREEAPPSPRVPWRAYADSPARTPPDRTPPGRETQTQDFQSGEGDADVDPPFDASPLLTNEELEALVGDPEAATRFRANADVEEAPEDGPSQP